MSFLLKQCLRRQWDFIFKAVFEVTTGGFYVLSNVPEVNGGFPLQAVVAISTGVLILE